MLQAQQHASKAEGAKEEPALWALQATADSANSSIVTAAKRLHPYRKQFKLLRLSQRTAKINSKRKQHMNILR